MTDGGMVVEHLVSWSFFAIAVHDDEPSSVAGGYTYRSGLLLQLMAFSLTDQLWLWAGYRTAEGKYYGTVARINAWDLKLKPGQISSSVMWLSSDGNNNQIMAAGFQISPDAYNDTDLHFFVSWTADGFNSTGCLNTQCQGFVSSTPAASISPGSTVAQPSVYHGKQADFTITILKDVGARKWSLYVDVSGTKQELVGHFPASLFTGLLADHATEVSWGGNAWSSASAGAAPPMGSGHGPGQGLGGSAYIASIGVFDAGGNSSTPAAANVTSLTDAKECYDASVFQVTNDDGAFFYYGGPNGCDH
ncbi:protein neprosin-like [Phragmites australis]|uniref:protein neprosin-like n=1 Tax=Phragmites australis TaxID=29695 RepID=UPI002D7689B9|nr:protein neprosin-like [Phragmites australis]